eukprot:TRINITY_DN36419_c0_g1_i1.p1 TRINITY_DN36419_c0_g1~~TRINITY_DN36419_c0_g1_i1.p1  ORF type:complete len:276 (-),score=12.95 TRINITY_DN36419_c0_g1_i1:379-1140(-)
MALTFALVALISSLAYTQVSASTATAAWTESAFNGSDNGACGYGFLSKTGYGRLNVAASLPLFKNGASCGLCLNVRCSLPGICNSKGVIVTVTDSCAGTAVCGTSSSALALSGYAFEHMAVSKQEAALLKKTPVTVTYKRVACHYHGNILLQVLSSFNQYYFPLNIVNVGGPGAIVAASLKAGTASKFTALTRDYGEVWVTPEKFGLVKGPFTVKLTATIGKKSVTITCPKKVPAAFKVATLYDCGAQFPRTL